MKSYAQNFEDVVLWRALQDVSCGFYIDLGAQHPVLDSVSRWFYEQDWRGVHVEPVPMYAELLRNNRPDEKVIEAVVSEERGDHIIYVFPDTGLSTMSNDIAHAHKTSLNRDWQERIVPSLKLSELFEHVGTSDVHWLKVDVEGHERSVLASWGDNSTRPWIVLVEATLPNTQIETHEEWESILTSRGYTFVYADGLNRYYLHETHEDLRNRFKYPPNYFDQFSLGEHWATADLRNQYEQRLQNADNLRREAEEEKEQAFLQSQEREERLTSAISAQVGERMSELAAEITLSQKAMEVRLFEELSEERDERLKVALADQVNEQVSELAAKIALSHEVVEAELRKAHLETRQQLNSDHKVENDRMIARIEQMGDAVTSLVSHLHKSDLERRSSNEALRQKVVQLDDRLETLSSDFNMLSALMRGAMSSPWRLLRFFLHPRKEGLLGPERGLNTAPLRLESGIFEKAIAKPVQGSDSVNDDTFSPALTMGELYALPPAEFIKVSYAVLLNREADSVGLLHYLSRMALGDSRPSIHRSIMRSKEYRRRANHSDLMGLDDEAFIEAVYRRVLFRGADDNGRAYYLEKMRGGTSRSSVVKDITRSSEARLGGQPALRLRRQIEASLFRPRRILGPGRLERRLAQLDFSLSSAMQRIDADIKQLRASAEMGTSKVAQDPIVVHRTSSSNRPRWVPRDLRTKRTKPSPLTTQDVEPHADYLNLAQRMKEEAPFGLLTDRQQGQEQIDDYLVAAYDAEFHNGEMFRWISGEAVAYLCATGPRFHIEAAGFFEERDVFLSFNDVAIGMLKFNKEQTFACLKVEAWAGKDIAIRLKCAGTFNPAAASISEDQRDLGLLIRSIYFD